MNRALKVPVNYISPHYPGFLRFAIWEDKAQGIADGVIDFKKKH